MPWSSVGSDARGGLHADRGNGRARAPSNDEQREVIVVTGAAGTIGTALRPRLARSGRSLVLVDQRKPAGQVGTNETFHRIDLGDLEAMTAVFSRSRLVVHLGAIPTEEP
ncbi:NAD-dependent epimerase/dehydratase family protein [Microbacterium phyllosphaerae]|uniref:NAD-dependent epimerase/dehydratase family protein n=1 Tax=Microbacterium phyllosphaerae TaxID=124798 RepID=UPI003D64EBE0